MIINLQKYDMQKIYLTVSINFIRSKDVEEERVMHSYDMNNDNNVNKLNFLLRKGVQRYEYMDEWENFMETSFPEKEKNIAT